MKPCAIIPLEDYENVRVRIAHVIKILDRAKVSKSDRDYAVKTLRAALSDLEEED